MHAVAVESLVKQFGPHVRALDGVTLSVEPGEVRGIIGENGAGKSTLMKILGGLYAPTAGKVFINGRQVHLAGPAHAHRLGIAMIHQELNLVDELSVAENIFLGREPRRFGLIARRRMNRDAADLLARLAYSEPRARISPRTRVGRLSIAQMQMVEIAKALSCRASVLIMDEPTAVLSQRETAALFDLIGRLHREGVTILYISHVLSEVLRICGRITIMRDGRIVSTLSAPGATEHGLARLMVGRELTEQYPPISAPRAEPALTIANIGVPGLVDEASLTIHRGEILGLAGLVGAGRTELAEAIVGLRPRSAGTVTVAGLDRPPPSPRIGAGGTPDRADQRSRGSTTAPIRSIRDAVRHGVAYLSEDRRGRGLILPMSLAANTTLVSLRRYCRPFIRRGAERASTLAHMRALAIRAAGPNAPVETLSGGNQQKVALAKWLEVRPRVLILDEPTRGVDVGAKREIYQIIADLADAGMACLLISSDLTELRGMCHRIAIMRSGRIAGLLDRADATEERIMRLAAGIGAEAA